ncbi:putative colanic acid biosynthesis acetyltransferase WcaB [Mucilaginibacter mallensis]|uniref:Serine acetyltransferase n=1 Tax=Mucilaginibacter mallensis TaxID=652787 RepID=A0A1H1NIP3_MUCMA|nr:DapH/DapD/GlmU-related protein [Mucilaginibacter mallensis]SDR98818.1 putative colanic acid biosynthesis acetyltransferase WcaB [Mucilaginibacter mallensis]
MNFFSYLFQDRQANRKNFKAQLVLFMFRLVQLINRSMLLKVIFILYLLWYRYWVDWVWGIELPRKLTVGKGLSLYHGHALVVNQGVVIGDNCVLRNSTTIGHKKLANGSFTKCPVIGNNVDIGANVCIIGDITIGDNVIIGAGSVVTKSFPSDCIIVGNPARILEKKNEDIS